VNDISAQTEGPEEPEATSEPSALDAARALLAENDRIRMEACADEIRQVLAKYGMRLDIPPPQIVLTPIAR
jgi:hypothetical protein